MTSTKTTRQIAPARRQDRVGTPNLTERLASCLLEIQSLREDPIPWEQAKLMTAQQIVSLFEADHDAGYACNGAGNHPTEFTMRLRAEHRDKTAKKDIPAIAKGKRIRATQEASRRKLLAKVGLGDSTLEPPKKRKAKIQSAPFQKATEAQKERRRVMERELRKKYSKI